MKQTFLEKLQSSDERTKTRWVVGISVVAMALVFMVWLSYFNGIVGQNPVASAANTNTENDFSFGQTVHDGTAFVFQTLLNKAKSLRSPREYMIKP